MLPDAPAHAELTLLISLCSTTDARSNALRQAVGWIARRLSLGALNGPRQLLGRWGIIEAMSSLHIRSLGDPLTSIWSSTAAQVLDLTASLSPTPGGGAISVFAASLGLALVHKGASISLKRAGEDIGRREALSKLCDDVQATLSAISGLADDDCQAFREYLATRSLPQSTEGEKTLRTTAMEAAILQATKIPLLSAQKVCHALEYAEIAVKLADLHLLTDIFGGALIMEGAARAVLLNVVANLALISDEKTRVSLENERIELEALALARCEAVALAYRGRGADSVL